MKFTRVGPIMQLSYYIRGDDGEEYGPVDLAELAGWARENRVGRGTRIRLKGTEGEGWQLWEERPELLAVLASVHPSPLFEDQPHIRIAPVSLRAVAYVIDMILIALPLGIAMAVFMQSQPVMQEVNPELVWREVLNPDNPPLLQKVLEVLGLGAQLVYFAYFTGRSGATPGKRWLGIRVVNEAGQVPGMATGFLRAIISLVSAKLYYLGFFLALVTPRSRALHDWMARTYVVRG